MTEGFDIAAIIAAAISGVISILSIMMSKRNDISLEKIKNDLEIKKMSRLHVEIMNRHYPEGLSEVPPIRTYVSSISVLS
jgi:hypothetical protein